MSDEIELEKPKPTAGGLVASVLALEEIKRRSFSGRHPELGKMIKCQVCQKRHRDSIKCEQKFVELWELEMQLHRLPQPDFRLSHIARPHQHIQRRAMIAQQIRRHMRPNVSRRSRKKYRHSIIPFPCHRFPVILSEACRRAK